MVEYAARFVSRGDALIVEWRQMTVPEDFDLPGDTLDPVRTFLATGSEPGMSRTGSAASRPVSVPASGAGSSRRASRSACTGGRSG